MISPPFEAFLDLQRQPQEHGRAKGTEHTAKQTVYDAERKAGRALSDYLCQGGKEAPPEIRSEEHAAYQQTPSAIPRICESPK